MININFKLALRYLAKNKIYSFINIAGLSLSVSCAMLMILYAKDELSFDKFHKNFESLYRIGIDVQFPDGSSMEKLGVTGFLQGPRFKAILPEIESYVRLAPTYKDIKIGEDIQSQAILLADTNFFTMFTFPLIQGDPKTALQQPTSMVITPDIAIRQFGTEDALNKTMLVESNGSFVSYTITGVAKRIPQNSSIQFDVLMPLIIPAEKLTVDSWASIDVNTFVKLHDGSDISTFNSKMQRVFDSESKEIMDKVHKSGFDQTFVHSLQPLSNIHLDQEYPANDGLARGSNPLYSYILSGIALFILAIACINFINLTIARSLKRAKEIGIRKVIGSQRKQLIVQFLGESFLLCCMSFIGSILLVQLLLPFFNNLVNKYLSLSYLLDLKLIAGYFILLIITGLLAGFYPAIVLSGFSPVQTLYNRFQMAGKNYLQKGLIVFQFTLATFMIIATITIYFQFDYLTTKDLGYDSKNIVVVNKSNLTAREAKFFEEELMKNANIVAVAPQHHTETNAKIKGDSISHFTVEIVNENFIDFLKIPILLGRNFSSSSPSDSSNAILVNEEFVKMAQWQDPIGQEVNLFLDNKKKRVIGVVKNYHYASLSTAIQAQMFEFNGNISSPPYRQLLIKIKPNSESTSLPHIASSFKKLFPMTPYSYQFLDEVNLKKYEAESKWKKVIVLSAFLTIFIASLGLFGLSILTAEKRFKEIGIRKVLGASVNVIVVTLSKDLLVLILIAMLVAMPFAFYATNTWLETYPYRTDIGPGTFIGAGTLVLIVALSTISYQSIKTALMNPVDALKTE